MKSGYVAIIGPPNAGKSTLLNAILGEKIAIVTPKPQTTRSRLLGIHSTDECQMIFLDTPGLHHIDKPLNKYMEEEINEAIRDADVVCGLTAVDDFKGGRLMAGFLEEQRKKFPDKKFIWVINKMDLHNSPSPPLILRGGWGALFKISALTGFGVPELIEKLRSLLPIGPAYYPADDLTDKDLRYLTSEIIREKVIEATYQEVPYSTAIEIISFTEGEKLCRIVAHVIVEQESQKGIVIGAKAQMIKKIGTSARLDIEKWVGTKVHLDLRVKVDKNWTKNRAKLAKYGYYQHRDPTKAS